jgi:4-alpha-glucanotransferase
MYKRGSGLLLHVSSLPSPHGIGELGKQAYGFVDFLVNAGQSYWQILPLNPTGTYLGNSPYTSYSVFAGNPLFISLETLRDFGLLSQSDLDSAPQFPLDDVDYEKVVEWKAKIFRKAFHHAEPKLEKDPLFAEFCGENDHWLEDFSLFAALKDQFHESAWYEWPEAVRNREENAISDWKSKLNKRMLRSKFLQFVFFHQWENLRKYANEKNIKIIGDIPIYPSLDSVDAWSNPDLFKLGDDKKPLYVAGAPPDYFSETGQRWGNPVYNWDNLKATKFEWWVRRMRHNLQLCDILRLDHFRGLVAYWEIPAEEETAVKGKWMPVPSRDLFGKLKQELTSLPLILEDLGHITDDVKEVMNELGFPGMKVLAFAFGPDLPTNPYAPHNFIPNCVVYTGTHDNNTMRGWYEREAYPEDKMRLNEYTGKTLDSSTVSWEMARLAYASVADIAVIPFQDILGLGANTRMNLPSETTGNWRWRAPESALNEDTARKLYRIAQIYNRTQQKRETL